MKFVTESTCGLLWCAWTLAFFFFFYPFFLILYFFSFDFDFDFIFIDNEEAHNVKS